MINLPMPDPERSRITIEDILADAESRANRKGLFKVQTAAEWIEQAKRRPVPKMLFGSLWFEGELCILFADTNLGKTILAVQIANSISRGEAIAGFVLEAEKQPVLYFDFELYDKQFEARYSDDFANHYAFDANFIRAEIDPDAEVPACFNSFEDYLAHSLEKEIVKTGAKLLVIDNMTYLKKETEKAKDALPLMKQLKALKSRHGLSILALAHTPKRDLSKPLTHNDLQGSKMLINFCDSAFAIGQSQAGQHIRYAKQVKARNTEKIYHEDNVCLFEVMKEGSFLKFCYTGQGIEREHLKQVRNDMYELEQRVQAMLETNPLLSAYAIAKSLDTGEGKFESFRIKINRIMNKIKTDGY